MFGLALFVPGVFNGYLIDAWKRKSVCLGAMLLFVGALFLYPCAAGWGTVALLRIVQGGLYGTAAMTTGSTLVIDVTASHHRTEANMAFAWAGRFGMAAGLATGVHLCLYGDFMQVVYACAILGAAAWLLVPAVRVPFRAPLHPPLVSLDRFLLPRALLPGANMLLVAFVFGVLVARVYNGWFYLFVLAGFLLALPVSGYVHSHGSIRSGVELGLAALGGGLFLLGISNSVSIGYMAGILIGLGTGISTSRFFVEMISLAMHCERGTGNNTYQLLWELGMAMGFFFGTVWAEGQGRTIYQICAAVGVAAWVMYEFLTHPWYRRQMEEK